MNSEASVGATRAVAIVGSLNADLVAYESDTWVPGSYNVGKEFELAAGGKGLNVAMSVAATGVPSYLVGRVGDDIFGEFLGRALAAGAVLRDFVSTDFTASTGIGHVRVNVDRDYDTCVVPGANDLVTVADAAGALDRGIAFSHVVMAFEIPLATVVGAARLFRAGGTEVVVNFSPVTEGSRAALPHTDVLVVNEAEASALARQVVTDPAHLPTDLRTTGDLLRTCDHGPRDVVVTLGGRGVWAMSRTGETRQYGAHDVTMVNAVGAGDTFLAVLVSRMAGGESLLDALPAAGAAGALVCGRRESWLSVGDADRLGRMVADRSSLTSTGPRISTP